MGYKGAKHGQVGHFFVARFCGQSSGGHHDGGDTVTADLRRIAIADERAVNHEEPVCRQFSFKFSGQGDVSLVRLATQKGRKSFQRKEITNLAEQTGQVKRPPVR